MLQKNKKTEKAFAHFPEVWKFGKTDISERKVLKLDLTVLYPTARYFLVISLTEPWRIN